MCNVLVTGACGQLGVELVKQLRAIHGRKNVIASDIVSPTAEVHNGPFKHLDVTDYQKVREVVDGCNVRTIYHLVALLSADAERDMSGTWNLNIDGLRNILDVATEKAVEKVFWPSSIAVFGPDARGRSTPQNAACNPTTIYGITKLAGEQLCAYYHRWFGLDVRSVRLPGLLSYKALPGGGPTDYAVAIFRMAVFGGKMFCSYLDRDCRLPMMYMSDAVRAIVELMAAYRGNISVRTSYNISSISFSPEEIFESIKLKVPDFDIKYKPDYRQEIASSWPTSINDEVARSDWKWQPEYDLEAIVDDMLQNLRHQVPE